MSMGEISAGTMHANALAMWLDHGDFPPLNVAVPTSELRLKSGLPFGLHVVGGERGPQEGMVFAGVAGNAEDLMRHPDGPLIRMHSACIFSEVGDDPEFDAWLKRGVQDPSEGVFRFGQNPSDECDCRAQRQEAQGLIANEGGVYLDLAEQEGRGWGLDTKRDIYRLQRDEGLDTAQACERLGIAFDVRRYGHCARFLLDVLNVDRVRLMSNNPRKRAALGEAGIAVTPLSLIAGVTISNISYLRTKRDKGGHDLPPDL